jgi:DNA-binding MarR family transcriptional regulator
MHQGHELAMLLRKAYLSFHRRANARAIKLGVTADQFVVLTMLAEEEGITQITIVERTASDPNTLTAILRLLERQGLVRREAHAHDGRARCVFLTPAGRRMQKRVAKQANLLLAAMWEAVDAKARPVVLTALRQILGCFSSKTPRPAGNGQLRKRAALKRQ